MNFPSVNSKQSFPELEAKTVAYWKENNTFQKSIDSRPESDPYRFYDGPPFITGTPHYGSLLSSIVKDIVGRYWTMQGKRVERVWGWDCHGLPIEEKVQKNLGIQSNKEIEKVGVKTFIDECYKYTAETSAEWDWYIDRIGRWVDMSKQYRTMDQDYMESVMWVFSELYKKGYIYEGKRVSLYSWKLGTPISNFEVAMDDSYQEVNDPAITVKFRLPENEISKLTTRLNGVPSGDIASEVYILAWTTTPWTIPAHMALAVNKDLEYVIVESDSVQFVVAKNRVETVFKGKGEYVVIREFRGSELVGLKYEAPFPEYYQNSVDGTKNHVVYHADFITDTDGTGIGHEAPEFGDVDFELAKQHGIHISNAMDEEGKYTAEVADMQGVFYQDANSIVTDRLQEKGLLFRKESITHRVPFCPRSGTPLMQKAQKSWFIDIQNNKEKLQAANEEIYWFPEHLKNGRFSKGIDSAPDWCISRTRYWGAPMPVWRSADGKETYVLGTRSGMENMIREDLFELNKSFGDLEVREVEGKKKYFFAKGEYVGMELNLHKPYIDAIKILHPETGTELTRVSEVLDVWMDSGSMPYAQMHYPFENIGPMEASFPADFIAEYVGQVRAWFYVMHVLGVLLKDKPAFKNVITTGVIYGEDGRKMSKSFKNYPDPRGTIEKFGADPIRFYLTNTPLMTGGDINFTEAGISDAIKRVILPLWNTYGFFTTYANIDGWKAPVGCIDYMRHGQTDLNVLSGPGTREEARVSGGLNDHELTVEGREQAVRAAKEILRQNISYDIIITTGMKRTNETARIIAEEIGFTGETITISDLRERIVSEKYEGKLWSEIAQEFKVKFGTEPNFVGLAMLADLDGAESDEVFEKRTSQAISRIQSEYAGKRVLIVAHGNVFRSVYATVSGVDRAEVMVSRHYRMSNCERVRLPSVPLTNPLDRWMISEVNTLTAKMVDAYARYDLQTAARELLQFLDNLTNWYVRRSRRRFWKSENDGDKLAAYDTLYATLKDFCKLAAPIIPFITEEIYRGLTGEESVHLSMYPEFDRFRIDQKIATDMKTTQELITLGLALRARKKLRVRQPLASMTISETLPKYYQDILLEELNIHEIYQGADMTAVARKICKPNARLIGPRFGKRVQEIIVAAKNGDFKILADGRVEVLGEILEVSEFELVYESVSLDSDVEGGGGRIVMMDTVVTNDLLLEGLARDVVRTIQELRKEADFAVSDRIEVSIVGEEHSPIIVACNTHSEYIMNETLGSKSSYYGAPIMHADIFKSLEIEGMGIEIFLKRM